MRKEKLGQKKICQSDGNKRKGWRVENNPEKRTADK